MSQNTQQSQESLDIELFEKEMESALSELQLLDDHGDAILGLRTKPPQFIEKPLSS